MVELAVNVRLATLGMTAVTVHPIILGMEVIVEDVPLALLLIQNKRNAFVTNPRGKKYMSMESAYVSIFFEVFICTSLVTI